MSIESLLISSLLALLVPWVALCSAMILAFLVCFSSLLSLFCFPTLFSLFLDYLIGFFMFHYPNCFAYMFYRFLFEKLGVVVMIA